jgi:elongation factor 1 alpha-like protein
VSTNHIAANGKENKKAAKTNGEKRADQIAAGVEAMKLDDTPRAKSKNLDVLAEFEKAKAKNAANFVVIGKIDKDFNKNNSNFPRSC